MVSSRVRLISGRANSTFSLTVTSFIPATASKPAESRNPIKTVSAWSFAVCAKRTAAARKSFATSIIAAYLASLAALSSPSSLSLTCTDLTNTSDSSTPSFATVLAALSATLLESF